MNTDLDPPQKSWVRVVLNDASVDGLKLGQPSLFLDPARTLFEEPTMFIHSNYVQSGSRSSPETWAAAAYGLQSWFDYLTASNVQDWRDATRNDLIAYRDSYLMSISPKTGTTYASSTVGNRMAVVLEFYKDAGERRLYEGDLLREAPEDVRGGLLDTTRTPSVPSLAGRRVVSVVKDLIPTRRVSRTAIRPFSTSELRPFLFELGPQRGDGKNVDPRPIRNRLIADLGWAVGLRLDEIWRLTKLQFLSKHPDPEALAAEQTLQVLGKGRITRTVAVPNWLVLDILYYIAEERHLALKTGGVTGRKETMALFVSGIDSNLPGRQISHRRIQQEIERACVRADLVETIERTNPETKEVKQVVRALHCFHDLRHTYAVLTYLAEVKNGNAEPWKKIQAQLGHKFLSTTIQTYLGFVSILGDGSSLIDIRRMIAL